MEWSESGGSSGWSLIYPKGRKKHVMLIGLVHIHRPLEHGFEDLVYSLNLAISMWVIGRGKLVLNLKKGWEFFPHNILKVSTVIRQQLLWDTKSSDDMVEKETRHSGIVICQHGLCPFGEIVDSHNAVLMTTNWYRIALHEVNVSLAEGTNGGDMM